MSVRIEKRGPLTTVILSRPEARNAVDLPTAKALADAFRAFDADAEASVAVLWGEGGTFGAGAERPAFSPEDGDARLCVRVEGAEGVGEGFGGGEIDGVAGLGAGKDDGGEGAALLDADGHGGRL